MALISPLYRALRLFAHSLIGNERQDLGLDPGSSCPPVPKFSSTRPQILCSAWGSAALVRRPEASLSCCHLRLEPWERREALRAATQRHPGGGKWRQQASHSEAFEKHPVPISSLAMPGPDGALTQGSLGQLSPVPGARGPGGEKSCFPVSSRLPCCLGLPGRTLRAAAGAGAWPAAGGRSPGFESHAWLLPSAVTLVSPVVPRPSASG